MMIYKLHRNLIKTGDIGLVSRKGLIPYQTNQAYRRLRKIDKAKYNHSMIFIVKYGRVFAVDMQPKGGDIRLASIHFEKKQYEDFVIVRPKDKDLIDIALTNTLSRLEKFSHYDFGKALDMWALGMLKIKTNFGRLNKDVCSELTQFYASIFDDKIGNIDNFFPQDHVLYNTDKFKIIM